MSNSKKQAVVLIHGVGEQVPMETLRGFVDAVWLRDDAVRRKNTPPRAWSKPDQVSGDYELRRLTTGESRDGRRTDFFEFYWAHLMEGTTLSHVGAWAKVLLWRAPSRVPRQLLGFWLALWMLVLIGIGGIAAHQAGAFGTHTFWWLTLVWAVVSFVISKVLIDIAGDAARYLHVAPANVAIRRSIREAGIKLLKKLHDDGSYDRIILVGHSLGTVIGYDILTHLWPLYNTRTELGAGPPYSEKAQRALEKLAFARRSNGCDLGDFQTAQSAYFAELQSRKHPWLVSDFITLGSPLAHASVLMSRNLEELNQRKSEREFPTCPPTTERVKGIERFTFPDRSKNEKAASGVRQKRKWIPHHAAVFAPTRWTNLYFPCHWTLWGDVIGGPIADVFGPGVRDVPVKTYLLGGIFSHTFYWTIPPNLLDGEVPSWIVELRKAVRISTGDASH